MHSLFTYKYKILSVDGVFRMAENKFLEADMLALQLLSEGGHGPDTSLSWLLYIGIAFFVMIIVFGWPEGSKKQGQAEGPREAPKGKKKADDLD